MSVSLSVVPVAEEVAFFQNTSDHPYQFRLDAPQLSSPVQNPGSNRVEVAPNVDIAQIFLIRNGYVLSVSYNAGQNTEYLIVGNSILFTEAVIADDHIVFFSDLDDSVQDVSVIDLVKHGIVFLAAFRTFFSYFHHVFALP